MAEHPDAPDAADAGRRAAARARLALRAERAFGLTWVAAVDLPSPYTSTAATPAAAPPAGRAALARAAPAAPEVGLPPPMSPDEARTAVRDLFGNAIAPPTAAAMSGGEDGAFAEPPPPLERRIELLRALDDGEVKGCTRCPLHQGRTHTVFGEGDPAAALMFIGEGPGENEDLSGRPFVGRAGQLLEKMIAAMGLSRDRVFITNVVKCRPPGNRMPTGLEVATCTEHYLARQLDWIRPRVIVTLGLPATRHLLKSALPMGKLRGQWHTWRGIRVMPTYHPAYLLRSYTDENRKVVWSDLQQVMAELGLEAKRGRPS